MATELVPGVFSELFARLSAQVIERVPVALEMTALAVERQAHTNASVGAHAYGTPTPATPGHGPARISGTLVESITHTTPRFEGAGWSCRVGARAGRYPTYQRASGAAFTSKTPSSLYGKYLETGLRNGATYPWLGPAIKIGPLAAHAAFSRAFAGLGQL